MITSATTYTPSELLTGDVEILRQQSLTRWMSKDLTQAAVDFCKNIGLHVLYCETAPDHTTRYLFWKLPPGALMEIRSGRPKEKFEIFDRANHDRKWTLLSLHVTLGEIYSAVWISSEHYDVAVKALSFYGITPAQRRRSFESSPPLWPT